MNRFGFSLVELLVILGIIGILTVSLVPNLLGAQKRAYDATALSCANEIKNKQALFLIDRQLYATKAQLTGEFKPICDSNIVWEATSGTVISQTSYSFDVKHINGTKTFTITNQALIIF